MCFLHARDPQGVDLRVLEVRAGGTRAFGGTVLFAGEAGGREVTEPAQAQQQELMEHGPQLSGTITHDAALSRTLTRHIHGKADLYGILTKVRIPMVVGGGWGRLSRR